jgi:hypothetical protein
LESSVNSEDNELRLVCSQFDEFADNTVSARKDSEKSRDYVDHKQWTSEEIAALQARKQPIITDNKIKDKVEYLEGMERKTRTDPKAYPRTPKHGEDADVATDAIRYVFDKNHFPQLKSRVFNNLVVEGVGGAEVIVDKKDPRKIEINYCRWDRMYYDPFSYDPDFKDAMYLGVITWMDAERAKQKWPKAKQVIETTMASGSPARTTGDTHDDKPRWADTKRKRIQVFEHYYKAKGTIYRCVFVKSGFVEEPAECPYVDDEDEHEWPLIFQSAYVDREGARYGVVKRYRDLQDEINKRRSKSLHLLNTKTLITEKGAFDNINEARTELHKPDGVLEKNPGFEAEIDKNLDLSAGHFQLLQQAEQALSLTGPNAALQGNTGSISGRAKEVDQQGGAIQIGVLFDSIRFWQKRIAQAVWHRIRQYWDEETWIRVTDDEYGLKFVALNEPMTLGHVEAKKLKGQDIPPEQKQAMLQQIAQDPQMQAPAIENGKQLLNNDVALMEVDIIIDEAPDVVTIQQEQFETLAGLAERGVQIPPEALIEASNLRAQQKKKILDQMSGKDNPMAQEMAAMQKRMGELEMALKEGEVRDINASAAQKEAAAVESHIDAAVKTAEFATGDDSQEPGQAGAVAGDRQAKAKEASASKKSVSVS